MISRLVDLELNAAASAELFEHLGKCAQCREFLDTMMKLAAELDKVQFSVEQEKQLHLPPMVKLIDRQGNPAGVTQTRTTRIRTAAFLALLVLIIGFVWSATLPNQEDYRFDSTKASPQLEILNSQH